MTQQALGPSSPVSVVICCYTTDRWDQLTAAAQSALEQDPRPEQVLLVVDHSPELEARARAELASRGVTVLANRHRRGLSGARNSGVEAATGDVVAFLDDDAVAEPGWLKSHLAHYEDPDVVGVGGLVEPAWQEAAPDWFPAEFGWVVGCSYEGQPATTAPVRNPIGANMSFRTRAVTAVGGFAEQLGRVGTLPVGCEETELSIRVLAAFPAARILHEPAAAVRHSVPPARGRWSYFRRRCWAEGRSKAAVSRLAGAGPALSQERRYVREVLPGGVRRNLALARRRRDAGALARAAAICAGLAITGAGYLTGQVHHQPRRKLGEQRP